MSRMSEPICRCTTSVRPRDGADESHSVAMNVSAGRPAPRNRRRRDSGDRASKKRRIAAASSGSAGRMAATVPSRSTSRRASTSSPAGGGGGEMRCMRTQAFSTATSVSGTTNSRSG